MRRNIDSSSVRIPFGRDDKTLHAVQQALEDRPISQKKFVRLNLGLSVFATVNLLVLVTSLVDPDGSVDYPGRYVLLNPCSRALHVTDLWLHSSFSELHSLSATVFARLYCTTVQDVAYPNLPADHSWTRVLEVLATVLTYTHWV